MTNQSDPGSHPISLTHATEHDLLVTLRLNYQCVLAAAVAPFTLFKRAYCQPEKDFSDDSVSESHPYASLVQVPVHFVIYSIKERLPVIKYSNFLERPGGRWFDSSEEATSLCAVCLALVNASDEVRELCNCSHIFHTKCLDGWVDQGRITCPLCRSKLWPDLNYGKSKGSSGDPWRRERMVYLFGED
ncbi:hypothetical protein RHSIM_Rhsim09G0209800 [Rhododendron simsii]|uniref:RING-type domain-containing protein n=1 Tax=Rhododendron simsii TaxID=118357 RepID=A0A834LDT1_RHOSS|nr:hypothetical protein RHSIM_Rhsim09G0209800 [Rhododendron simsii]